MAEFWTIVTHPRASGRPSTPQEASAFIDQLAGEGGASIWSASPGFGVRLARTARDMAVTGARVFDLQIALIAREAGARELWTHDARFVTIAGLAVTDPLESQA